MCVSRWAGRLEIDAAPSYRHGDCREDPRPSKFRRLRSCLLEPDKRPPNVLVGPCRESSKDWHCPSDRTSRARYDSRKPGTSPRSGGRSFASQDMVHEWAVYHGSVLSFYSIGRSGFRQQNVTAWSAAIAALPRGSPPLAPHVPGR